MDGSVKYKTEKLFFHFQKIREEERAKYSGVGSEDE